MSTENHDFLAEFPPSTYEGWKQEAIKLLKGAAFEKKLFTETYEGITLAPIYMSQKSEDLAYTASLPGFAPYLRGTCPAGYTPASWHVAQEIADATPEACNEVLRTDLERGQTTAHLLLDQATRLGLDPDQAHSEQVGRGGVSLATVDDLEKIFKGIDLEVVPVCVEAGVAALPLMALLAALFQKQQKSLARLRGWITNDPLHLLVCEGALPCSCSAVYDMMAEMISWTKEYAPHLKTIGVQGDAYHNSGGSAVQELACGLATAVEYLRAMLTRGLAIDEVAPRVQFMFPVGAAYFMEIAKLRAARLLWAKIIKAFGGNETSQRMAIHVCPSQWNATRQDPYVNMLRATVAAFAGVLGGCDSLHVGCFDEPFSAPDDFSRRIARNTQTILKEEAHIHEVIDPAGGSWYVEQLTDQLARAAWTFFQEIETQGGMAEALKAGFPQARIAQVADQRLANLAIRKDVLVGVNMYPDMSSKTTDSPPGRGKGWVTRSERSSDSRTHPQPLPGGELKGVSLAKQDLPSAIQAALAGATLGSIMREFVHSSNSLPTVTPLRMQRAAELFENVCDASEAYTLKTGALPTVFLANMGPLAQHKVRADFATEFFQVGGFEVIGNQGFSTVDEAVRAALNSGAPVVVICSTDDTYPAIVPAFTQQLKAASPETLVILAGYPKEHVEAFKQAGVDEFIYFRANVCAILANIMKKLGIMELI